MDIAELQELIRILEDSKLAELEIEEDGRRVRLSKQVPPCVSEPVSSTPPQQVMLSASQADTAISEEDRAGQALEDAGLVTIDSPMVGTFYTAPAADKVPYVSAGDTVEPEQTLCIVEAMKIMNEVVAKFPAIVERVLVDNAEPVEFGQPLFAVRPLV